MADIERLGDIDFGCRWPPNRQNAALWLVQGLSVVQVARKVGVAPNTVYTWLAEPEFKHWVGKLRDRHFEESFNLLVARQWDAADALGKLLRSPDPAIRLKASIAVIRLTTLQRSRRDFAERLSALESRLGLEPPPGLVSDDEIFPLNEKVG